MDLTEGVFVRPLERIQPATSSLFRRLMEEAAQQ